MSATPIYKVRVALEMRQDGGLRAWSDDLPELVLSHLDASAVLRDLPIALQTILSDRLGRTVEVSELLQLPERDELSETATAATRREFAARIAA